MLCTCVWVHACLHACGVHVWVHVCGCTPVSTCTCVGACAVCMCMDTPAHIDVSQAYMAPGVTWELLGQS